MKRDVMLAQATEVLMGAGLGAAPSPVGFPDFNSFQNAVIASFPPCPPPYDPSCENPRDAAIAAALESWKTTPGSCGVVVCDASGQPAVTYTTYTTPSGQTATGYVVQSNAGPIPVPAPAVAQAPAPLLVSAPQGTALPVTSPRPGFHTGASSAAPAAPVYSPTLVFTTSRGTNSLLVGDTWQIVISGAAPNTPVSVTGNSCGACTDSTNTNMGATDGNGSFILGGTIAAGSIGVWAQQWMVGSQSVGHVAFTVAAGLPSAPPPAAPPPGSGAPPAGTPPPAGACDPSIDPTCASGTPATGAGFFQQTVSIGGFDIPVWAFIAAAGGAVLLFMGETK
jgi:hypothetical protein